MKVNGYNCEILHQLMQLIAQYLDVMILPYVNLLKEHGIFL